MTALAALRWAVDRDVREGAVRAMLATLPRSAESVVDARHLGPVTLGASPRWLSDGTTVVFERGPLGVAVDARLTNRAELRSLLGLAPTSSDAELIVGAYERWGRGCPNHLDGEFAFALWNERDELFCARDRFGTRTLYYGVAGSRWACASGERAVLAGLGLARRPRVEALVRFVGELYADSGPTLYADVSALPPAHSLTVRAGSVVLERYWRADACRELELSPVDAADRFRSLLGQAVERCTESAPTQHGILVSGGLDSTSVAATQHAAATSGRTPPATLFHLVFPGLPCDESRYARAMAAKLAWPLVEVSARATRDARLEEDGPGGEPCQAAADWHFHASAAMVRPAIRAAHDAGVRVMLTGHGSDSFLSGTGAEPVDALTARVKSLRGEHVHAQPPLRPTWAAFRAVLTSSLPIAWRRGVWSWRARRAHRVLSDTAVTQLLDEEASRIGCLARMPKRDESTAVMVQALENWDVSYVNSLWAKLAALEGVEVHHPFFDRELVEFILALPHVERWAPAPPNAKPVLRRAMGDMLAREVALREDSTDFSCYVEDVLFRSSARRLRAMLADSRLATMGVVHPSRVQQLLVSPKTSGESLRQIGAIVAMELWLRQLSE